MNCKKIQELILTDYLDQEMPQDKQKELENHLAACAECRNFVALAKKTVIEPLANIKTENLSQSVIWSKIQKEIQAEKQSLIDSDQAPGFLENLKNIIFFPKPGLALSTFAVIAVLIIVFNIRSVELAREEYLSYFLEQDDGPSGYGTELESYFL